jgi:hypothetical protein
MAMGSVFARGRARGAESKVSFYTDACRDA